MPKTSAVVPGQTDAEPIMIHANHSNMVKFTSSHDSEFVTISETLQIMVRDAENTVMFRWDEETRVNAGRFLYSISDVK